MKLIHCTRCGDTVALLRRHRTCDCGQSGGHYEEDGITATITGNAVPVGINNESFRAALRLRPQSGMGEPFTAFVIPHECPTVRRV